MEEEECYFDAHNHLLDYTNEELETVVADAFKNKVLFCAANATREAEYDGMMQLSQRFPLNKQGLWGLQVVPSFGVHPYFLQFEANNPSWQHNLQQLIGKDDRYCIGQIGIDYRKDVLQINSKQTQQDFFLRQLEMSFLMNRTVTVHCVRAHVQLLKMLKKYHQLFSGERKAASDRETQLKQLYKYNPIIMHSFGGSKEITTALLKLTTLNIYFSLCLNRSEDICTVIPLNRLILETDAPHQNNIFLLKQQALFQGQPTAQLQKLNEKKNRVDYVRANVGSLCGYYHLDRTAFARTIFQNTMRVFRLLK